MSGNKRYKLTQQSIPAEIKFAMELSGINQSKLKEEFEVSQAAISQAINSDPLLKKLRAKIINYLNTIQFNRDGGRK